MKNPIRPTTLEKRFGFRKKRTLMGILILCVCLTTSAAFGQEPEVTYTRSSITDERVPMYLEPSSSSQLIGEYFDGVAVDILELVSDEWAHMQIATSGLEGHAYQGYMHVNDLVFGELGEQVQKTTVLYMSAIDNLYLQSVLNGPGGESGPFGLNECMELIGIVVPAYYYERGSEVVRPLSLDDHNLHIKTGNITGFLDSDGFLKPADQ